MPEIDPEIEETFGREIALVTRRADSFDGWMEVVHVTDVAKFVEQRDALKAENAKLREALIDARASFLGLQPDFGGPVAAQMGKAIERINAALA